MCLSTQALFHQSRTLWWCEVKLHPSMRLHPCLPPHSAPALAASVGAAAAAVPGTAYSHDGPAAGTYCVYVCMCVCARACMHMCVYVHWAKESRPSPKWQNIKLLMVLTKNIWSENEQDLNKCPPATPCATICWFTFAAVNYLGKCNCIVFLYTKVKSG